MSLPRHFEKQAQIILDTSQKVRYDAFKIWIEIDQAASPQDRFLVWHRHESAQSHLHILDLAKTMCDFSHEIMDIYLENPNKRGFTTTPPGFADENERLWGVKLSHPHTIVNVLKQINLNCMFIGKYILDSKCRIDLDSDLETDCNLCLRPAKTGPQTRSNNDHVVCSQCAQSWCALCASSMENQVCPYCRKEW